MVWRGSDGHDREIFYYDGTTVRQLTNNDNHDYSPQIHNGQVVWYGYDADGHDYEIYYHDVRPDLRVFLFQPQARGRRWDPLEVKLVVWNRGFLPARDFYVDIYKDLSSPPGPWWVGDASRFVPELGPREWVVYHFNLTYDMDGTYNIWVQLDTDRNVLESNEDNNIAGPIQVEIDPDADVDRDGDVDGKDLAALAATYGLSKGDSGFNTLCDFAFDWVINGADLADFSPHYGREDCPCLISN